MSKAIEVDILKEVEEARRALAPAAKRLAKALSKLTPDKLPFGAASDLLYQLRAVSKAVPGLNAPFEDCLGPAIKALEESFVQRLKVGEASGVQGLYSRTQVTESVVPSVAPEDWPKVWAFIAKTKGWDLLTKALNRDAVRERWEAKKQLPGVGKFIVKKVSCTKLSGKGGKG